MVAMRPARSAGVVCAEQQRLHGGAEVGRALHRQVGLGAAGGQHRAASASRTRVQHRDAAGVVEVDADRQVDLVGRGSFWKGLVEAEDRVAGVGFIVEGRRALGLCHRGVYYQTLEMGLVLSTPADRPGR
jgi:hypothetical protein